MSLGYSFIDEMSLGASALIRPLARGAEGAAQEAAGVGRLLIKTDRDVSLDGIDPPALIAAEDLAGRVLARWELLLSAEGSKG